VEDQGLGKVDELQAKLQSLHDCVLMEACKDAKVQQDESYPSNTDLPALYRP